MTRPTLAHRLDYILRDSVISRLDQNRGRGWIMFPNHKLSILLFAAVGLLTIAGASPSDDLTASVGSSKPVPQASDRIVLRIDQEADIVIDGDTSRAGFGKSVAVGDINGDGIADLAVGANNASIGGRSRAGATYLKFGPIGAEVDLPGGADIVITGADERFESGTSLAIADVDADGSPDLLVGSQRGSATNSKPNAGVSNVLLGPLGPGRLDLATVGGVLIQGVASRDESGSALAFGDVSGDGVADLLVGASQSLEFRKGTLHVVLGPLGSEPIDLESQTDITIVGSEQTTVQAFARFTITVTGGVGTAVAVADLNGDGQLDVAVSAENGDVGDGEDAGHTYVFFGPLQTGSMDATTADVTITGQGMRARAGSGVAAGDLNGDGVADLVIGSDGASARGVRNTGKVSVLTGPLQAGTIDIDSAASLVVEGANELDRLGGSVNVADINGDGKMDLIIGTSKIDVEGVAEAGSVSILLGSLFDRESTPAEASSLLMVWVVLIVVAGAAAAIGGFLFWSRLKRAPSPQS